MSLADFEHGRDAIELRVPWLEATLWWVPTAADIQRLVEKGVARGRIWTARELRDLASLGGAALQDVERIARLKAEFGCDILRVVADAGSRDDR